MKMVEKVQIRYAQGQVILDGDKFHAAMSLTAAQLRELYFGRVVEGTIRFDLIVPPFGP